MAQKKEVKVQDLKPKKDAKGGRSVQENRGGGFANRGGGFANRGGGSAENRTGGQANATRGGAL